MTAVGMDSVFSVGALFAFTGVGLFLALLWRDHGRDALTRW